MARNGQCLRPYPFPFRAALSIINDSRNMSEEAFWDWHCAPAAEALEVGDSLRFASDGGISGGGHRIELARAGLIDGVCGLPGGGADLANEALARAGVTPCWYAGDSPLSAALGLKESGVSYFSDPGWMVDAKFGDHMDYRTTAKLQDAIDQHPVDEMFGNGPGGPLEMLAGVSGKERLSLLTSIFNRTIVAGSMTGGDPVSIFKRWRGGDVPSANTFPVQARSVFLDRLVQGGGAVLIAQRFGEWSLIGRGEFESARSAATAPVFGYHELTCWSEIGQRQRRGELFVALPGRLLRWLELRARLVYKIGASGDF